MSEVPSRADCDPVVAPTEITWLAADMTALIGADVRFCDLYPQDKADHGLWVPIDCQGNPEATLAKLVERNATGPLRLGYGGWRDLLLGCQFINGRGELITAGGRTVKNVAGYDLTKFMVGQSGVFGKIVSITLRIHLKPEDAILAEFEPDIRIFNRLIASSCRPQWAVLTDVALHCGYLGNLRTIEYQADHLPGWGPGRLVRHGFAADCQWRQEHWRAAATGEYSMRASVPPSKMTDFVKMAGLKEWVGDPAFGIVLGAVDNQSVPNVTSAATSTGGRAWFWKRSDESLAIFTPSANEREILKRLKLSFDPNSTVTLQDTSRCPLDASLAPHEASPPPRNASLPPLPWHE